MKTLNQILKPYGYRLTARGEEVVDTTMDQLDGLGNHPDMGDWTFIYEDVAACFAESVPAPEPQDGRDPILCVALYAVLIALSLVGDLEWRPCDTK